MARALLIVPGAVSVLPLTRLSLLAFSSLLLAATLLTAIARGPL
jgi:hypothetical protein